MRMRGVILKIKKGTDKKIFYIIAKKKIIIRIVIFFLDKKKKSCKFVITSGRNYLWTNCG
jgi:hypothetical protein